MKYNKPWHSEWYKAKLCLWMICEFLRSRETDSMGEWGTSIKELGLLEFQQRVGSKIIPEEEELPDWPSNSFRARKKRRLRENQKLRKEDYEEYLRQMRERARKNT